MSIPPSAVASKYWKLPCPLQPPALIASTYPPTPETPKLPAGAFAMSGAICGRYDYAHHLESIGRHAAGAAGAAGAQAVRAIGESAPMVQPATPKAVPSLTRISEAERCISPRERHEFIKRGGKIVDQPQAGPKAVPEGFTGLDQTHAAIHSQIEADGLVRAKVKDPDPVADEGLTGLARVVVTQRRDAGLPELREHTYMKARWRAEQASKRCSPASMQSPNLNSDSAVERAKLNNTTPEFEIEQERLRQTGGLVPTEQHKLNARRKRLDAQQAEFDAEPRRLDGVAIEFKRLASVVAGLEARIRRGRDQIASRRDLTAGSWGFTELTFGLPEGDYGSFHPAVAVSAGAILTA